MKSLNQTFAFKASLIPNQMFPYHVRDFLNINRSSLNSDWTVFKPLQDFVVILSKLSVFKSPAHVLCPYIYETL